MIAILNLLSALVILLIGFGLLVAAFFVSDDPEIGGVLGPILGVIGLVMLLIGIALIIMSVGLLRLRPWARTITRVLVGILIVLGILTILSGDWSIIYSLAINIIVFLYLGMSHVREAFEPTPPPAYQQARPN